MSERVVLTPCEGKSGLSRLPIVLTSSCYVEFLAIMLLAPWRSLTPVYPRSSHGPVRSDFDGSPYQPSVWEDSDQPQYVRSNKSLVTSWRWCSTPPCIRTALASAIIAASKRAHPIRNACHPPRNGPSRRRPVQPPGSNTRVCLDFVWITLHLQRKGGKLVGCPGGTFLVSSLRLKKQLRSEKNGPHRCRDCADGN